MARSKAQSCMKALWLAFLTVFFNNVARSDFSYPDFSTLCYRNATCKDLNRGTLDCCQPITDDKTSALVLNGAAHFQTCAQTLSSNGKIAGLTGKSDVTSPDTAMEPRTWLTELIEADYVDTDRMFTTVNYSRSIFEETVRRRDELRARLLASQSDLASAQLSLSHGLEPDSHGQRWLIVATLQAQTDELARLYNETMARDAALRAEHATEFAAIMPREMATCDNRLRLTPSAPGRAGAAWHATAQRVEDGFQATFLLQVSARNRLCRSKVELQRGQMGGRVMTEQRDECLRRDWSLDEWNVREFGLDGGDGFAFVIQGAGTATVGGPGAQLGYGGLAESVAVEFDMFYDADLGDANDLHVALHANGHQANGPGASTRMGQFRGMRTTKRLLQDGEKHTVRVVYTPGMDFNPFAQPSWPAEPHLFQVLLLSASRQRSRKV
mmetsp:Transcript_71847/g.191760  ORF Transcript_71847/g.191760 Transcript_71847/m.191760 type:complete len:440 (-) Transcript_71847:980-2299(-)